MLQSFISVDEIRPSDVLVFDTSSLSHAFEDFSHATISAYMEMDEPRTWIRLKHRILRRIGSEATTRRLLLDCDSMRCLVPQSVVNELREVPRFEDSLNVMFGMAYEVEQKYVRRRSGRGNPVGFSTVFKPRMEVATPRKELVDYVLAVAKRHGIKISRADAEGIALAMETNGVLVTADRKQAEVADKLGVRVLFTIPRRVPKHG